jgi:hypothetical protein
MHRGLDGPPDLRVFSRCDLNNADSRARFQDPLLALEPGVNYEGERDLGDRTSTRLRLRTVQRL